MANMKNIQITPEVAITDVALGLGGLGVRGRAEEAFAVMDRYLEYGGNCIDTARKYADGETDEVVGQWIKSRGNRERIVLVTKGAFPGTQGDLNTSRLSPEEVRRDLEDSLKAAGTDYADIFYLHRDDIRTPVEEIMPTLDKLVKEGKTRAVGASNWTVGRIAEANAFAEVNGMTPFSTSQILYSLARTTSAQTGDLTHIAMNDVEYQWYLDSRFPITAYSTQAKGFFARYAAGLEQKPNVAKYFAALPDNLERAKRLMTLSEETGVNVPALSLAYVRASRLNAVALVAFSSIPQMEESMKALQTSLSPAQITYLETGIKEY